MIRVVIQQFARRCRELEKNINNFLSSSGYRTVAPPPKKYKKKEKERNKQQPNGYKNGVTVRGAAWVDTHQFVRQRRYGAIRCYCR